MPMRLLSALAALSLTATAAPAQPKPTLPTAPPPREVAPAVPADLADWTPRPAAGKAEPWERATDKDWVDGRFKQMNTGPFLNATFRYPNGKGQETVYKGTAIRLGDKGDAAVLFDRNSLRLAAGWTGGYLKHGDRRFGLLNTPTPAGGLVTGSVAGPGWASPEGTGDMNGRGATNPLPSSWAKYRGLSVHGGRVALRYTVGKAEIVESAWTDILAGVRCIVRTIRVGPLDKLETVALGRLPEPADSEMRSAKAQMVDCSLAPKGFAIIGVANGPNGPVLQDAGGGEVRLTFRKSDKAQLVQVAYANDPAINYPKFRDALEQLPKADDPLQLTMPGPAHWGKPIVTKLERGKDDGPFAIDTLAIPYDNPFKALFFCTGVDFLPDGRVAVCTCHGDVWLVRVDEAKAECHWQRFATGLYHPLGLKVVDGKVVVLERGQLTRLHDNNSDGEADFYECLCNDWDTGAGEHSYDTCLETDPDGNFYFFKTGDTNLPTGGCLMKVAKDGGKAEVFATGFRHPIGLGMSPTGIVTGADQEGNWMPATRIDEYRRGGFYGDMRAHHRKEPPKVFDPPLCWLPREVDNSAGGQVWVPEDSKWPLAGLPLHLSYGRCKVFVLLRQPFDGGSQGGVWDLGLRFLSGVCRGRFAPDGHLYVCGLNGWQTCAEKDGCLQRVRYTGKPLDTPVKMEVVPDGLKLTFSRALDRATAEDPTHYRAAWWNYRWSGEYGSKRYKPSGVGVAEGLPWFPRGVDAGGVGQDDAPVTAVKLSADGRTVHVEVRGMRPVMQMQIGMNLRSADGAPVVGSVFLTVHRTGK